MWPIFSATLQMATKNFGKACAIHFMSAEKKISNPKGSGSAIFSSL
jgi:hypothetical protein